MRPATSTIILGGLVLAMLSLACLGMFGGVTYVLVGETARALHVRPVPRLALVWFAVEWLGALAICLAVGVGVTRHGWPRWWSMWRAWRYRR